MYNVCVYVYNVVEHILTKNLTNNTFCYNGNQKKNNTSDT